MNVIDAAVVIVILLAALRGYWRGFLRELFGFAALVAAVVAAMQWSGAAAELLIGRVPGPDAVRQAVAFTGVFLAADVVVNLVGLIFDRLAAALMLTGVNRAAGSLFGAAKGAAVMAAVLLFIYLFPPTSKLDEKILTSSLGRPLMNAAGDVLRLGVPQQPEQGS